MTIKELIEELESKRDPSAKVYIYDSERGFKEADVVNDWYTLKTGGEGRKERRVVIEG